MENYSGIADLLFSFEQGSLGVMNFLILYTICTEDLQSSFQKSWSICKLRCVGVDFQINPGYDYAFVSVTICLIPMIQTIKLDYGELCKFPNSRAVEN